MKLRYAENLNSASWVESMNRISFAILVALWPCVASADAPFAPLPNVPDYIATYIEKPGFSSTRTDHRTVMHHSGWVRVSRIVEQRSVEPEYHGPGPVSVTVMRDGLTITNLIVRRGADKHVNSDWSQNVVKTGERGSLLGESCEIWDVARSTLPASGFQRLSCVTVDGIELWNRFIFDDKTTGPSYEATQIKRQPVPPNEVRPPLDWLNLNTWSANPKGAPQSSVTLPDVTVILRSEDETGAWEFKESTVRQHHPWTYQEVLLKDGRRRLSFLNGAVHLGIDVETNTANEPAQLQISKWSEPYRVNPVRLDREETVLGERCSWFDMTPGQQDAGHTRCQTADGIALKEESLQMGRQRLVTTAIKLSRAPLKLEDVMPPPAVLAPETWGISK